MPRILRTLQFQVWYCSRKSFYTKCDQIYWNHVYVFLVTNQKLVFANAGYYDKDVIKRDILPAGNEQDRKVFKTYEDKRLASKASVIKTKDGVPSFNIAGTANPTEEGL